MFYLLKNEVLLKMQFLIHKLEELIGSYLSWANEKLVFNTGSPLPLIYYIRGRRSDNTLVCCRQSGGKELHSLI